MVTRDKHGLFLEFAGVAAETGWERTTLRPNLVPYRPPSFVLSFHKDGENAHWYGARLTLNDHPGWEWNV